MMALSGQIRLYYIKIVNSELNIDIGINIHSDRIDDRITNLSNSTKVKKSFTTSFLTFETSLVFI